MGRNPFSLPLQGGRYVRLVCFGVVGVIFSISTAQGQLHDAVSMAFDTVRPHTLSGVVGLLGSASYEEGDEVTDISLLATTNLRYVVRRTEYKAYWRQYWEQNDDRTYTRKVAIYLNPAVERYRIGANGELTQRRLFVEPTLLGEVNTDRGLRGAVRVGALLYPLHHRGNKFHFSMGCGGLFSFESWDMNNPDEMDGLSPEDQQEVDFINSNLNLHQGRYYHRTDLNLMVALDMAWKPNKLFQLTWVSYLQLGFLPIFNQTIRTAYPELGEHHPHWVSDLTASVNISKSLSANFSFRADYQRSLLVLYESNFEYHTLLGLNWKFTAGPKTAKK